MAYFNHSSQSNCVQLWERCTFYDGQETFPILALARIPKGTELTVDYDVSIGYEANGREGHVHRFLELCDSVDVQMRPSKLTRPPVKVIIVPPFEDELLQDLHKTEHVVQKEAMNESKGNLFFVPLDDKGKSMALGDVRFDFNQADVANRRMQKVFRTTGKIHSHYFSDRDSGAFLDLGPCTSEQREDVAPDGREGFVQDCEFGTMYAVPEDRTKPEGKWSVWQLRSDTPNYSQQC
jgi:hypothetical protein